MSNAPFRPATAPQVTFLKKLLADKEVPATDRETIEIELINDLSVKGASFWIDTLKRLPRAVVPTLDVNVPVRARATEEGFYKNAAGDVFKVVISAQGRPYAKLTTARGLQYVAGAMNGLFADMMMSGEEIAAHGVANSYCVNCSHELEDPTSKHIGLGTSCGPRILGAEGYKAAKLAVADKPDVVAFEAAKKVEAKERREAKKRDQAQLVLV